MLDEALCYDPGDDFIHVVDASCVPEALSSIRIACGEKRASSSIKARLSSALRSITVTLAYFPYF